jgi:hypothetical protein
MTDDRPGTHPESRASARSRHGQDIHVLLRRIDASQDAPYCVHQSLK